MAGSGGTRAVVAALLANLGIAVAKFVGFLLTRSSSMLAEAVHSVADSGNQGLLLFGGRQARREPTAAHPFGYGRERFFWSFVVAVVLFALGSLFALYEGYQKLTHPHPITSPAIAVGILAAAIVLESFSFRTAITEANQVRGGASWWAFVRRHKSPELPVVLLEDLGALVGLILALGGVALAIITDDVAWDGYGTLAIGVLLGVVAIVLAVEMKSMLIGEAATPDQQAQIVAALAAASGVQRVLHCRTLHLGPDELLVGAKVALEPSLTFREVADAIDAAEASIRHAVPIARVIYVEPDTWDHPTVG